MLYACCMMLYVCCMMLYDVVCKVGVASLAWGLGIQRIHIVVVIVVVLPS